LAAMRASIFLRSPDVYDPLEIFLHELILQEIGILICGLNFSGTELTCHDVLSGPSSRRRPPVCHGSRLYLHHISLDVMYQCCYHGHHLSPIEMLRAARLHSTGSSFSHPGGNDEDIFIVFYALVYFEWLSSVYVNV